MATIASLAAEYDMQPYELQAYADLNETGQHDELDEAAETFVRDLLDNSTDGTYTASEDEATGFTAWLTTQAV